MFLLRLSEDGSLPIHNPKKSSNRITIQVWLMKLSTGFEYY